MFSLRSSDYPPWIPCPKSSPPFCPTIRAAGQQEQGIAHGHPCIPERLIQPPDQRPTYEMLSDHCSSFSVRPPEWLTPDVMPAGPPQQAETTVPIPWLCFFPLRLFWLASYQELLILPHLSESSFAFPRRAWSSVSCVLGSWTSGLPIPTSIPSHSPLLPAPSVDDRLETGRQSPTRRSYRSGTSRSPPLTHHPLVSLCSAGLSHGKARAPQCRHPRPASS